jgi:hypothetical protein
MINQDIIAQDLFYKIRGRFPSLEMGDEKGMPTFEATKGRFFDFDAIFEGVNLGKVSINIKEPGRLKIYFNRNILENADDFVGKQWFSFLKEMRRFAMKRIMSLDTRDISKSNLDKKDFGYLANKGPIMSESAMFGTSRTSYKPLENTKLIIIHTDPVDESIPGARSRHIKSLFVQNKDGERFKYPFIHKLGAECMLRHVANGGYPHDDIGKSIVEMSKNIAHLASFKRYVSNHDLMNNDTNHIVGRANETLQNLKETMRRLTKQHHYEAFKESMSQMTPTIDEPIDEVTLEDYKNKFTVKSFQENIADVFPILHKIMQETNELNLEDVVSETYQDEELDENIVVAPEDQFNEWASEVVDNSLEMGVNEANLDNASNGPVLKHISGNQFQLEADGQSYTVTAEVERDGREYDDPVFWTDASITDSGGQRVDNPVLEDEVLEMLDNQFSDLAFELQSDNDAGAGDMAYDAYKDSQYEGQGMHNELNDIRKMAGLKQQEITDEGKFDAIGKVISKVGDVAGKVATSVALNPVSRLAAAGTALGGTAAYQANKDKEPAKEEPKSEPTKEEAGDQTPDEKKAAMEYMQSVARAIKSGEVQPEEVEQEFFNTLPMMGVSDEKTMAAWDRITGNGPAPKRSAMSDKDIDAELKGVNSSDEEDDDSFLAKLRGQAKSGSIKADNTGFGAENEDKEDMERKDGDKLVEKTSSKEIAQFIMGFYDRETGKFPLGETGVQVKVEKEFGEKAGKLAQQLIQKLSHQHHSHQAFEDLRRLSGLPQLTEAKKKKGDGNLANNAKPYDKVTQGDVVAGRLGKDEKGGKATKEGTELDDIKALSGIKEAKGKCCCEEKGEDKCPVHGKVEEAKEEKCNHTPKGTKCPVHGVNECMGKEWPTTESKKGTGDVGKPNTGKNKGFAGVVANAKKSGYSDKVADKIAGKVKKDIMAKK